MSMTKWISLSAAAILAFGLAPPLAQAKNGPGVTATEITLGQTMPYSGPASAYGVVGQSTIAYFNMINDHGGINGRKVKIISLDDGYSPPRTVEQTRKLVEEDHVLAMFASIGTPTNTAVHKYLNDHKVPQLLIFTGASKWDDPAHFHWTMGFLPSYQLEGRVYAHYILKTMPNAKIGVLYQDDDYGKDYLTGFLNGLGAKAKTMIVKEASYETSDPTVDSQIISLKASGANVFFNITIPSFAAKAIKEAADIGWRPTQFLNNVSNEFPVMKAAGLKASVGLISTLFVKDPTDPEWHNGADYKAWVAWMDKYQAHGDKTNVFNVWGYVDSQIMAQALKQCGNDLTRANLMRQVANLKNFRPAMAMPGVVVNTGPTQYAVLRQLVLAKFNGKIWVPISEAVSD